VVIPAFNEAERLPPFLEKVVSYFEGRDEPYEVIVVDDGSTDGTADIVGARDLPAVRVLRLAANAGKGAAVRAGMLAAKGAYRVFADADGATPIEEIKRLEPMLVAGADVVIGSRVLVDPGVAVTTRPTISPTTVSRDTAPVRCAPHIRPSRITTLRSAIAKTSARRCETNRQATPRADSERMWPNRRWAS